MQLYWQLSEQMVRVSIYSSLMYTIFHHRFTLVFCIFLQLRFKNNIGYHFDTQFYVPIYGNRHQSI